MRIDMFTRRGVLTGLAGVAAAMAFPAPQAFARDGRIAFDVFRGTTKIGEHSINLRTTAAGTEAEIDIALKIKAAFITVFDYQHTNRETWQDGRLVKITTRTTDNGKAFALDGRADGDAFVFEGSQGPLTAPLGIYPTSYWNYGAMGETQLLDTQRGKLLTVTAERGAAEPIEAAGQRIEARPYKMRGDLNIDLWYTLNGEWAKLVFDARGAKIEYQRTSPLAAT